MIRILLPLICAALGFAAASCSQSEGPLAPAGAQASAGSTLHGTASAAMVSAQDDSSPSRSLASAQSVADTSPETLSGSQAVERRASTLIGMPVVSADGSSLGEVKDIIFDRQGRATHLVITYDLEPAGGPGDMPGEGNSAPSATGKLTAIPWDAAVASIKSGRLVLGSAMLRGAPSFTPDAWPNLDDPAWSAATDAYWRKAVRAAIAAHPGTPIDSTSRGRARPTRDGN